MQVQSKHGRESNLNFKTFENLVRRVAVKERDERNKRKGNSCPWRSFCETDEGNDQKRELRGGSRGVGRRGRDTDAVEVITLFTVISHFIS